MREVTIIGAGLFGITTANLLGDDFQVSIYEKRGHIGGNCFDYIDRDTGICIHAHGPHIFHIDDPDILDWISRFTSFNNYKHQVKTCHAGCMYDFPINLATLNQFFGSRLEPPEMVEILRRQSAACNTGQNLEERLVAMLGYDLYEAFFKHYTYKQWGKEPKYLPPDLIRRIPIHTSYSTSYYKKYFNGIPADGFTAMFKKMLNNKKIKLFLGREYTPDDPFKEPRTITIYTGLIDKYFNFCYGKLDYRTLGFVQRRLPVQDFQGVSVVNYPDADVAWTRICEPKHFYPEKQEVFKNRQTIIIYEIPGADNADEPYYPIGDAKNTQMYDKYASLSSGIPNLYFGGRLGSYRYYDMENCICEAFKLADKIKKMNN